MMMIKVKKKIDCAINDDLTRYNLLPEDLEDRNGETREMSSMMLKTI